MALNRNFSNIIRSKLKKMKLPEGSKTLARCYAKCIMDFEHRIKNDFRNNGQKWAVDVGIENDYPDVPIDEGYMVFDNEEVLRAFTPVINRVIELIQNQLVSFHTHGSAIKVSRFASLLCKTWLIKRIQLYREFC